MSQVAREDVARGDECEVHGGTWSGAFDRARGGDPVCTTVANGYAPAGECRFVHVDRTAAAATDDALMRAVVAAKAVTADLNESIESAGEALRAVVRFYEDAPASRRRTSILSRAQRAAALVDELYALLIEGGS